MKSLSDGDVLHELRLGRAHGASDHALLEREAVRDHRVPTNADRPQPAVLEHESGDAGTEEPFVQGPEGGVDRLGWLLGFPCRGDGRIERGSDPFETDLERHAGG